MTFKELYYCQSDRRIFFAKTGVANKFFSKAKGLLFGPPLAFGQALHIQGCGSVHTCFMAYPIDVIYLDKNSEIIKLVSHLKPWRFSACLWADSVVEVPAGYIAKLSIKVGGKCI